MTIKGHVEDGVIVLDETVPLPEGAMVTILIAPQSETPVYRKYRGTPYSFPEPFEPALSDEDWDSH